MLRMTDVRGEERGQARREVALTGWVIAWAFWNTDHTYVSSFFFSSPPHTTLPPLSHPAMLPVICLFLSPQTQHGCNHIWQIDSDPNCPAALRTSSETHQSQTPHAASPSLPSVLTLRARLDHRTCRHATEFLNFFFVILLAAAAVPHGRASHCRWAARSNLFVLRWFQFRCHRTLGPAN